jgi:hypothetical protein
MFIFDLDSTLANIDHRLPYKHTRDDGTDAPFNALCVNDTPIPATCRLFRLCSIAGQVRIWTGRTEAVRGLTLQWIAKYVDWDFADSVARHVSEYLMMRPVGDTRPDHELKEKWLNELPPDVRAKINAVFDDRDRVVQMYRRNGVICYQVADGNF